MRISGWLSATRETFRIVYCRATVVSESPLSPALRVEHPLTFTTRDRVTGSCSAWLLENEETQLLRTQNGDEKRGKNERNRDTF